jgi:hypothetical protein
MEAVDVATRTVYIRQLQYTPSWDDIANTFCDEKLVHLCYSPTDPSFDGIDDDCTDWHLYAQFADPVKPSRFIDAFENDMGDVKPIVTPCKNDFMSLDMYRATHTRWSHRSRCQIENSILV